MVPYGTQESLIFDLLRHGEIADRVGGPGGTGGGAHPFPFRFQQISQLKLHHRLIWKF